LTAKRWDDGHEASVRRVVEGLEPLGYQVSFGTKGGAAWVPQHRERVFIVGSRDDVGFDLDDLELPRPATGPRLNSILHQHEDAEPDGRYTVARSTAHPRYTLSDLFGDIFKTTLKITEHVVTASGSACLAMKTSPGRFPPATSKTAR